MFSPAALSSLDYSTILRRVAELAGAFTAVWVLRLGLRFIKYRAFRHLPGPPASSLLWGHEWELASSPPGQLYAQWRKQYGHIVQFDGCFGVRHCPATPG